MQLLNLSIDKIIIHQVYQRTKEGEILTPLPGHDYTRFDSSAMSAFKSRVVDALGEDSKAVQMHILNQDASDLPMIVDKIVELSDADFAVASYEIAKKLAKAQHRKSIPGGIVVVFSGTQGVPAKKFLGIIKAEVHSGYEKIVDSATKEISLKFVEELLLTPGTKLYKTAAFFEKNSYSSPVTDLNDKWAVLISDYQISQADGKVAAQYFFSDFLGCGYPESSARTTKLFYEKASKFIEKLEVSPEKKSDFLNALTTYLKVGASSTISSNEFASTYFEPDTQDFFKTYMEDQGLPTTAFTKDIAHVESQLKFRRVNFPRNIRLVAPADVFKNSVIIETINGELDASGSPKEWTRITIKDKISHQE